MGNDAGIRASKPRVIWARLEHNFFPSCSCSLEVQEHSDLSGPGVLGDKPMGCLQNCLLRSVEEEDDGVVGKERLWVGGKTAKDLEHRTATDCIIAGRRGSHRRVVVGVDEDRVTRAGASSSQPHYHVGDVSVELRHAIGEVDAEAT